MPQHFVLRPGIPTISLAGLAPHLGTVVTWGEERYGAQTCRTSLSISRKPLVDALPLQPCVFPVVGRKLRGVGQDRRGHMERRGAPVALFFCVVLCAVVLLIWVGSYNLTLGSLTSEGSEVCLSWKFPNLKIHYLQLGSLTSEVCGVCLRLEPPNLKLQHPPFQGGLKHVN